MKDERKFKVSHRGQSKLASAVEALVNTAIGLVVAIAANMFLFWVYNIPSGFWQIVHVASWMVIVSTVRSYFLRRAWNSEFWLRIDWRRMRMKPKEVTITRYTEMPGFRVEGRIDPKALQAMQQVIATRIKEQTMSDMERRIRLNSPCANTHCRLDPYHTGKCSVGMP